MPARALELHPEALEDALSTYAWYLEHSARAADVFLAALERAVELVLEAPERWPLYLYGSRRLLLKDYPYSLVYKASRDTVVIYAVAHAKRRPGYWKRRLGWSSPST